MLGVYLQGFKKGSTEGNRPPPGQTVPLLITGFPETYMVKLSLSEHRSVLKTQSGSLLGSWLHPTTHVWSWLHPTTHVWSLRVGRGGKKSGHSPLPAKW